MHIRFPESMKPLIKVMLEQYTSEPFQQLLAGKEVPGSVVALMEPAEKVECLRRARGLGRDRLGENGLSIVGQ